MLFPLIEYLFTLQLEITDLNMCKIHSNEGNVVEISFNDLVLKDEFSAKHVKIRIRILLKIC